MVLVGLANACDITHRVGMIERTAYRVAGIGWIHRERAVAETINCLRDEARLRIVGMYVESLCHARIVASRAMIGSNGFVEIPMQALIDLLPVVAFFVAYYLADFQTAIVVIMVVMTVQVIVTRFVTGKVSKMLLASAGLVVGLGGISLLLQNELIFKWKPTVLNWSFALIFLGSQYIGDRPVVQRLLETAAGGQISLSRRRWHQLNAMWVIFFLVCGTANIVVAYSFSEEIWVNFKLFGLLGLTFVFIIIQTAWLNRHSRQERERSVNKE